MGSIEWGWEWGWLYDGIGVVGVGGFKESRSRVVFFLFFLRRMFFGFFCIFIRDMSLRKGILVELLRV